MSDAERLAGYIEVWKGAVDSFVALLEQVPEDDWTTPTDLPGWDVKALAAHTAHLESVLAGNPEETADVGEPPHVTGLMGLYTEIGVVNRRDRSGAEIVAELREVTDRRYEQLRADPPTDADARPEVVFGGVPWSWETLLRNRPLDVWMHEQDARRALGRPGGLDTPAAQHTVDYLLDGFGYVLGKKVGAPAGTTAVIRVEGSEPASFIVNDAGRGERLPEPPADPTVELATDRASYVVLAGGRCGVAPDAVAIEGDAELGRRIVAALATTP